MKDKVTFACSLAISVTEFSTAKEFAKMIKEPGLNVNPKGEGEYFAPKEGLR